MTALLLGLSFLRAGYADEAQPSSGFIHLRINGALFLVDSGATSAVSTQAASQFQSISQTQSLVRVPAPGRSVIAETVTPDYLKHYWMDPAIAGVLGSDFLGQPVWMDFAAGSLRESAGVPAAATLPMLTHVFHLQTGQTFTAAAIPIRIADVSTNCMFDTGTPARFSDAAIAHLPGPALRPVNVLEPTLFEKLSQSKGVIPIPGGVLTPAHSTQGADAIEVPALIVPDVSAGPLQLHNVVFIREQDPQLFSRASGIFNEPVQAQCAGGSMFHDYLVRADFAKQRLELAH